MVLDTDPSSESLPYELILKIKKGTLPGFSPNFSSVETYLNNQLYDASPMGSLEFNRVVEFKMMSLDIDMVITLTLFTKRSPSSTSTARGSVSISLKEFRSRVNTGSNDFDLPFLPSGKTGGLLVGVEVREKQLFCIESTMPPLLRELSSLKEIQLSSQLKRKVYAIDNASKGFLHLILSILTEDADLISEAEVYDITNDVHLMLLLNEAGGASYRKMVKYFYADTLSTNTAIVPTILYPYTKRRFRSLVAISSSRAHKTFFKAIRNSVYDFNHKFQSQELSASSYLNLVNERQYLCEIDTTIVDSSQGNPNSYDISLHCNTGYTYEIRFPYFCDFSNVIRNLSVIKQMLQNDDSSQKEMDDYYTSASLIVNDHGKLSEDEYDRASYTRNKAIRQDVKLYLNYSEQALSMRIAKYHQNSAQLEDPSTAIIIVPFKTVR